MDSLFILVGPIVWFIFLEQYVFTWTMFWSLDMLFYVFLTNSMAPVKLKRGKLGTFMLGEVCWGQ